MRNLSLRYLKSTQFRTIPVHGAVGSAGTSPGRIEFSVYSERVSLPDRVTLEVADDGTVVEHRQRPESGDFERELESHLVMDLENAVQLHALLGRLIQQALGTTPDSQPAPSPNP